mgnify:CR=1 FL=1
MREAPFIVVPARHLHQATAGDLGERCVKGRAVRIVVEVNRHERQIVVAENALETPS